MVGSREVIRYRQLNGKQVSPIMYEMAQELKRRGAKAYLTSPGALPDGYDTGGLCANCGGCGSLYLEYATGGPYDNPPAHKAGTDADGKRTGPTEHPAWFPNEGKWYRMTMTGYPCVVCEGGQQQAVLAL